MKVNIVPGVARLAAFKSRGSNLDRYLSAGAQKALQAILDTFLEDALKSGDDSELLDCIKDLVQTASEYDSSKGLTELVDVLVNGKVKRRF